MSGPGDLRQLPALDARTRRTRLGPEARGLRFIRISSHLFRFSLHLCSRFDAESLAVRDGPTLLVQAPPFRAEGMESFYIAGTLSLNESLDPINLLPRRYQASPKAKFVPDPSYSPAPRVACQRLVRRTRAMVLSQTPRRVRESNLKSHSV